MKMKFFTNIFSLALLAGAANCASVACSSDSIDKSKLKTCGAASYDKSIAMCCSGVVSLRPGCSLEENHGCCGSVAYDKEKFQCCQGVVRYRYGEPENQKCCGTMSYDEDSHMCCQGSIYPRPDGFHESHKCCNGVAFNSFYNQCKEGIVRERDLQELVTEL